MPKFRKRPIEVDAEQWFPGKAVPGVQLVGTKIHYSVDRSLYYVTRSGCQPDCWLTVVPDPGEVSAEDAAKASMFRQIGQFRTPEDGVYSRMKYPFAFNEVKSGPVEDLSEDATLFLDYAATCEWLKNPGPTAFVTTIQGRNVEISPGEWVIAEPDGVHFYPCKADVFEATYEPV